jgi:hypothetical protein
VPELLLLIEAVDTKDKKSPGLTFPTSSNTFFESMVV